MLRILKLDSETTLIAFPNVVRTKILDNYWELYCSEMRQLYNSRVYAKEAVYFRAYRSPAEGATMPEFGEPMFLEYLEGLLNAKATKLAKLTLVNYPSLIERRHEEGAIILGKWIPLQQLPAESRKAKKMITDHRLAVEHVLGLKSPLKQLTDFHKELTSNRSEDRVQHYLSK